MSLIQGSDKIYKGGLITEESQLSLSGALISSTKKSQPSKKDNVCICYLGPWQAEHLHLQCVSVSMLSDTNRVNLHVLKKPQVLATMQESGQSQMSSLIFVRYHMHIWSFRNHIYHVFLSLSLSLSTLPSLPQCISVIMSYTQCLPTKPCFRCFRTAHCCYSNLDYNPKLGLLDHFKFVFI